MAFSQSIDKGPIHLRWVLLNDLKGLDEETKSVLEENWPYSRTDFGGGVRQISLLDLLDVNQEMLLKIPGIGPKRAEEIARAVDRGKREQFPYRIL